MSFAREVTTDNVRTVLSAHGIAIGDEEASKIHDLVCIQSDRVESAVLRYTDIHDQSQSALYEIEDVLAEENVIRSPGKFQKRFAAP